MSLYGAFGLTIESPVQLPELLPENRDKAADVTVTFGAVDTAEMAPEGVEPGAWWQAAPSERHTAFGCSAGVFEIRDGSEIKIDPLPDVPEERLRMFLLGSAMGAVQAQRGRVPVHGGAVVSGGRAVIITGRQGSGKSTMTSALVHNGFSYLTDDVSSVILDGETPVVLPAYPQRKLVRDACISLGYNPEELPVIDPARDKFAIRDRERWHSQAARALMLIELIPVQAKEPLRAESVLGHARLGLIMRSLYRLWMHLEADNLPTLMFKKILTIAANMEMYRVDVPRGIENIAEIAGDLARALGLRP